LCLLVYSQEDRYDIDFSSPMDIPLLLSGNFGELRSNHFHTGIDIKTQGVVGKNIRSIEKGYVSRINISPGGYGNAIYIDHPNGFTSVYAHLHDFSYEIKKVLRSRQYLKKSFAVDFKLNPGDLLVNKGEVIGLSGNSGSSFAPHLHFEIRETKTELPVNPLLFGFEIKDNIPPMVSDIIVYSLDQDSLGPLFTKKIPLKLINGVYKPSVKPVVINAEKVGVAINTIDKLNASHNKCGIYEIELLEESEIIFKQEMEKLDFFTNRYINVHTDYEQYKRYKKSYHRSFIAGNNKLSIYQTMKNKGEINLSETPKNFQYLIKDTYGNTSTVFFQLKTGTPKKKIYPNGDFIDYKKDYLYQSNNLQVEIPSFSLYQNQFLKIEKNNLVPNSFSQTFTILNQHVPSQQKITLKIKTEGIQANKTNKAIIVRINNKGKMSSLGGYFHDGWIESRTKTFGKFVVMLDEAPPKVKAINIYNGKDLSQQKTIKFKITDDLSGIQSYNAYVDDKWILMQYSPKEELIYYEFDNDVTKGIHVLKLVIKDGVDNQTVKEFQFKR